MYQQKRNELRRGLVKGAVWATPLVALVTIPVHAQTSPNQGSEGDGDSYAPRRGCTDGNLPFEFANGTSTYTLANGTEIIQTIASFDEADNMGSISFTTNSTPSTEVDLAFSEPLELLISHTLALTSRFDAVPGDVDRYTITITPGATFSVADPDGDLFDVQNASNTISFSAIDLEDGLIEPWTIVTQPITSISIRIDNANPRSRLRLQTHACV